MVKNEWGHSDLRTLKLTLSQRAINGINWLLVCCHKFRKAKSSFDNFWVLVFKNVCDLLDLGTLKTALSHELMKWTDFFAKIYSNSYWVGIVKNGWGLIRPYGTLKSRASHKWFDELSRLIKWLLHADNNGDSQSVVSLIFECWGALPLYLAVLFRKSPFSQNNKTCSKMTLKKVFALWHDQGWVRFYYGLNWSVKMLEQGRKCFLTLKECYEPGKLGFRT